jgi:hypothetical protein
MISELLLPKPDYHLYFTCPPFVIIPPKIILFTVQLFLKLMRIFYVCYKVITLVKPTVIF